MYIIKACENNAGEQLIIYKEDAINTEQRTYYSVDQARFIAELRLELCRLKMKIIYYNTNATKFDDHSIVGHLRVEAIY